LVERNAAGDDFLQITSGCTCTYNRAQGVYDKSVGLISPQHGRQGCWIPAVMRCGRAPLSDLNSCIVLGLGHPYAPPSREQGFDLAQIGLGDHDRQGVEHAVVGVHLPGQAIKCVEVAFDFKAKQAVIGQRQIHTRRSHAELLNQQLICLTGTQQSAHHRIADLSFGQCAAELFHGPIMPYPMRICKIEFTVKIRFWPHCDAQYRPR